MDSFLASLMSLGLAGMIGVGVGLFSGCILIWVVISCCCCLSKDKDKNKGKQEPKKAVAPPLSKEVGGVLAVAPPSVEEMDEKTETSPNSTEGDEHSVTIDDGVIKDGGLLIEKTQPG